MLTCIFDVYLLTECFSRMFRHVLFSCQFETSPPPRHNTKLPPLAWDLCSCGWRFEPKHGGGGGGGGVEPMLKFVHLLWAWHGPPDSPVWSTAWLRLWVCWILPPLHKKDLWISHWKEKASDPWNLGLPSLAHSPFYRCFVSWNTRRWNARVNNNSTKNEAVYRKNWSHQLCKNQRQM